MARGTHQFQAPKGTRDFYPDDLAIRRHLEGLWREVSIRHGFDEIEGPTFEHLDLYTVKSGPGIVSELFSFRRAGGDTDYALRPEFTPTLARMYAARAGELPTPTKWFCIPDHFRAERPQRGRLREFGQWNVDLLGDASPLADAEVIAVAAGVLDAFGLTPDDVRIRISHRGVVTAILQHLGVAPEQLPAALELIDRRDKMTPDAFRQRAAELGLDADLVDRFATIASARGDLGAEAELIRDLPDMPDSAMDELVAVRDALRSVGAAPWCAYDLGIVRGLAYYTGTVFEVHEVSGRERAIAGGGRYDGLVELFDGPPTPAVGFAMGDVVIRLVLEDRGLLADPATYLPRPDVFVIATGTEAGEAALRPLVAELRAGGLHARHTYRATRNVKKLLGEAGRTRARCAVILGDEFERGLVVVKDLDAGSQREVPQAVLLETLRELTAAPPLEEPTCPDGP